MTTRTRVGGGYADPDYARALTHLGTAVQLPMSGVSLLRRPAPLGHDLVAPYPLLRCARWQELAADLEDIDDALCVVAVTDPFSDPGPTMLRKVFPDLVRPWKDHHIVTLGDSGRRVSSHHRRNTRKATATATRADPGSAAAALVSLYALLADRHHITTGGAAFPPAALCAQLAVHGTRTWLAVHDGSAVGIVVAYVDEQHAWYHLGASSPEGYGTGAMYALFARMLDDLADEGVAAVDLGAGAGSDTPSAGLERFKRGWSDHSRPTHLVGRILDRGGYERACGHTGTHGSNWFPAYREGAP